MQQPPNPYNYDSYQQQPSQGYGQPYPPQQQYGQSYPPQPYNYPPPSYAQPVMAMPDPLAGQRRRMAFSRGLLSGLLMILVVGLWVAYAVIPQIPSFVSGPALSLLQAIPVWFIYYFAGRSAARAAGKVGTGVITCVWATLWYLLADLIGFFVIAIMLRDFPNLSGFGLDITLALFGLGIGALGASKGAPKVPVPNYQAPPMS